MVGGNVTASSFIVPNALGTQFLKGDGTLDGRTFATAGANSNITSLTGLTTALSLAQGGTGLSAFTGKGVMIANDAGTAMSFVTGSSQYHVLGFNSSGVPTATTTIDGGTF